jgi:hypothetical protein
MSTVELEPLKEWGHDSPAITPAEMVACVKEQAEQSLDNYARLAGRPRTLLQTRGVLSSVHYDSARYGTLRSAHERRNWVPCALLCWNRRRRELQSPLDRCNCAPLVVQAENLYSGSFDNLLCRQSLLGPFSKVWFPKELTDPSAQNHLLTLEEELLVPRWVEYWQKLPKPRKGLLAPIPESGKSYGTSAPRQTDRRREVDCTRWRRAELSCWRHCRSKTADYADSCHPRNRPLNSCRRRGGLKFQKCLVAPSRLDLLVFQSCSTTATLAALNVLRNDRTPSLILSVELSRS